MGVSRIVVVVGLCVVPLASAQDRILPPIADDERRVLLELVAGGLAGPAFEGGPLQFAPTDLAPIPDGSGRLLVATLGGVVRLIGPDGGLRAAPFLDTTTGNPDANVANPTQFGMTSVCVHPEFADPLSPGYGAIYTLTTENAGSGAPDFVHTITPVSHDSVITEWRVDPVSSDQADPTSGREILRVLQPRFDHNVNDMAFGADGYLYIAIGDGGNSPNASAAAALRSLAFGKILRIDPDRRPGNALSANAAYAIPSDNPWVGDPPAIPEGWARGLRNPYRISFDSLTGDLWSGDVGQTSIESVDVIVAGGHYGWNLKEGSFLYNASENFGSPINSVDPDLPGQDGLTLAERNGLIDPVTEYDHVEGRSVIGGVVYRGAVMTQFEGVYLFGEFTFGKLLAFDPDSGELTRVLASPDGEAIPSQIYSINADASGELYLLGSGSVFRLGPPPEPCVADWSGDGTVDSGDFFGFISAFLAGEADVDGSGATDSADFFAFIGAFIGGC